jgi:hypothetical protein
MDMGSSNGVFFQEQRVARHGLRHGDAVRCGSLWLRFVDCTAGRAQGNKTGIGRRRAGLATGAPPDGFKPTALPAAAAPNPVAHDRTPGPVHRAGRRRRGSAAHAPAHRAAAGRAQALPRRRRGGAAVRAARGGDRAAHRGARPLKLRVAELEATLRAEGGDAKVQRAGAIAQTAAEIVSGSTTCCRTCAST